MYKVLARIQGTSPLLHHAFGTAAMDSLTEEAKSRTGQVDYSLEWIQTMYAGMDGYLFQPATHLEGALQKAASAFKIKGKAGKTFKDAVKAYAYVAPEQPHLLWGGQPIPTPTKDLVQSPTDALSVSIMRVKVQRAAVARSRLMINTGWELDFGIDVTDLECDGADFFSLESAVGVAEGGARVEGAGKRLRIIGPGRLRHGHHDHPDSQTRAEIHPSTSPQAHRSARVCT